MAIVSALCPVMRLSHMTRREIAAHAGLAQGGNSRAGTSRADMLRGLDAQLAREGFPAAEMLIIDEMAGDRIPEWLLADRPRRRAERVHATSCEDDGAGERELLALLQVGPSRSAM